ncbi:MAG: hypothetical protein ACK5EQ_03145, partial [Bacteroidota bacterium]
MIKSNTLFGIVLGIVVGFSACKKANLDLDKYSDLKIQPGVVTPLASISITAGKILKQDSITVHDPDGLIRFLVRQDSIVTIGADSILSNIALPKSSVNFKLGEINVPNINQRPVITLQDLVDASDTNTKKVFYYYDGKDTIFPAMSSPLGDTNYVAKANNYEYIHISKGYLKFTLTNNFPTVLTNAKVAIYDRKYNKQIGTLNYNFILPAAKGYDSIEMAGVTMSNDLAFQIIAVNLEKSSTNVRINLADNITLDIQNIGMKTTWGRAIIPSQVIQTQLLALNLSSPTDDYKLRNVRFGAAAIPFTAESKFAENLNLSINFPDATVGGSAISPTAISLPKGSKTGTFDLSNANIFLGAVDTLTHNMLRVAVSPSISSSGNLVDFDSSDFVKLDIDPANIIIDYVDGYMGQKTWTVDVDDVDFDALAELGKGLTLTNPKMSIIVKNSFGIPILLELSLIAKDNKGASVDMQPPTMLFGYPTIAQAGTTVNSKFDIDKSNSKIVEALGLPPTKFAISGKAYLNKDGFKGYNDFVSSKSSMSLSFEANMPLSIIAQDFSIRDTAELKETLKGLDIFDFLELKIKTTNGFPLEGALDLYFADANGVILDSLVNTTLVASGIPDATGKVVTRTENMTSFLLDKETLKNIATETKFAQKLIFVTHFYTYNKGTQSVNIHTDN